MTYTKAHKFLTLSFREKLGFMEALSMLFFSRVIIYFIPLRKLAPYLGRLNGPIPGELSAGQIIKAEEVRMSILMSSANVPWKSVCLDQALATMMMLKRRKISYSLHLGVKKTPENESIKAHAWVICNDVILVGGQRSKKYTVVASFSKSY